jgi:hypothetical protein
MCLPMKLNIRTLNIVLHPNLLQLYMQEQSAVWCIAKSGVVHDQSHTMSA